MDKPTADQSWNHLWNQLSNAKLVRYLLLFALAWAIVQVLAYFETVLIIFIFAAILAFLLSYPVQWVSRHMPHWLAVMIVFLLSLLVLGGLIATLGLTILSQAQQLLEQVPQLFNFAIERLDDLQSLLKRWNFNVDFSTVEAQLREQALSTLGVGFATLQNLLFSLLDLILIAVVAFFYAARRRAAMEVCGAHLPTPYAAGRNCGNSKKLSRLFLGTLIAVDLLWDLGVSSICIVGYSLCRSYGGHCRCI